MPVSEEDGAAGLGCDGVSSKARSQEDPADQEMADASPVREEAAAETPVPRVADIEMDSSVPVDPAFLEALPRDLREEMLAAQAVSREAETEAAPRTEAAQTEGAAEARAVAAEPQPPAPEGEGWCEPEVEGLFSSRGECRSLGGQVVSSDALQEGRVGRRRPHGRTTTTWRVSTPSSSQRSLRTCRPKCSSSSGGSAGCVRRRQGERKPSSG